MRGGARDAIVEGPKWLEREGCAADEGIIVVAGGQLPETEMHGETDFVPSRRDDVDSKGFQGFYRGYPVVWFQQEDDEEAESNVGEKSKPQCQNVVGVDMSGWTGLRVRREVVEEGRFGELRIRTWSDDEINQAIASRTLDSKDADRARGNCQVDITFFREHIKDNLPKTKTFQFSDTEQGK